MNEFEMKRNFDGEGGSEVSGVDAPLVCLWFAFGTRIMVSGKVLGPQRVFQNT